MSGSKHSWNRLGAEHITDLSITYIDSECDKCKLIWYSKYNQNTEIEHNRYVTFRGYEYDDAGPCPGEDADRDAHVRTYYAAMNESLKYYGKDGDRDSHVRTYWDNYVAHVLRYRRMMPGVC